MSALGQSGLMQCSNACLLRDNSGRWASGIEDGIGYIPGILIGISAGKTAPLSCWKVGRS